MDIKRNFLEEFADLICTDIPQTQIESYPDGPQIPEKYRKNFIHPENGFVKQFCEEYEEKGVDVVVIGSAGTLDYSTQGLGGSECCDQCSAFRLLPDPDPDDWFRDGDMKAVCLEVNGVIASSLEKPSECTNIPKPLFCPKLGRELNDEEKKIAPIMLHMAIEMMKAKM